MNARSGLRVRCEKGVNVNVRKACLDFAVWLRMNLEFPVRVAVYLKSSYQIKTMDTNELVSATFFAPYDKNVEPHIRVAAGDYEDLVKERGEMNAIYAIVNSMAHEIIHYRQWMEDRELDEAEAEVEGLKLVEDYYEGSAFFDEAVQQQKVWTIAIDEGIPIAENSEGDSIMPFWSTKTKAEKIINIVPAYRNYQVQEITLDDFLYDWINELEKNNHLIGTNWCGKALEGHEMLPREAFERVQAKKMQPIEPLQ
ncbi:DUF2750 domain-containing protein [Bacillus mangrovi]|uniref:DUF2750 domain-containing protein n=1 Tax=Metabacillus mangrovi TaxID=1491830 RepID=A0A7X2S8Q9_9BACI|nr:DUF2750 domain-containing protein [Metabacillus mangrovi]MTH55358.1 DUF2750 domain-containing protein [Metabacillus mangrovi]